MTRNLILSLVFAFSLIACGDDVSTGNETICASGNCSQPCDESTSDDCSLQCNGGSECSATCHDGQSCRFQCSAGASCNFSCGANPASCVVMGAAGECSCSGDCTGSCGASGGVDAGGGGGFDVGL